MELDPRDGRRRETARGRDADELREFVRDRVALESSDDPRRDDEDRGNGGERQLESRVEQRVRVPREEDGRADEERLPTVPLPRREPREGAERRGDAGAHDGRMETDRERVRGNGGEGRDLCDDPSEPGEEHDRDGGASDRRDLQAIDGKAVIQPRRAEVGKQRLPDEVRAAEDDRLDDASPLAAQAMDTVAGKPPLDVVAESVDPAAPADDPPRPLCAEDNVDPLPP